MKDTSSTHFVHEIIHLLENSVIFTGSSKVIGPVCEEGRAATIAALNHKLKPDSTLWISCKNPRSEKNLNRSYHIGELQHTL